LVNHTIKFAYALRTWQADIERQAPPLKIEAWSANRPSSPTFSRTQWKRLLQLPRSVPEMTCSNVFERDVKLHSFGLHAQTVLTARSCIYRGGPTCKLHCITYSTAEAPLCQLPLTNRP